MLPCVRLLALLLPILMAAPLYGASADIEDDPGYQILTGDTRLACEAILCLSSCFRPPECRQALNRYFSIRVYHKHSFSPSRTIKARANFLKLCPRDDNSVDRLVDAQSDTLNACGAEDLNKRKVYYARAFDVLAARWSEWRLLGRSNDDYDGRMTNDPRTNMRYRFKRYEFPGCSGRQLEYAAKLAAGKEERPYSDDTGLHYPLPLMCYQTREEIDPTPPADCKRLFETRGTDYSNLKYTNNAWRE
jgi:hypothetical protein